MLGELPNVSSIVQVCCLDILNMNSRGNVEGLWSNVYRETTLSTGSFHYVLPISAHVKNLSLDQNVRFLVRFPTNEVVPRSQEGARELSDNFSAQLREGGIRTQARTSIST